MKIIYLEDCVIYTLLIKSWMEKDNNSSISITDNEEEFFNLFISNSYDVILLDYIVKDYFCSSIIRKIKSLDLLIPIIIITGEQFDKTIAECFKAGSTDFISKHKLTKNTFTNILNSNYERSNRLKQLEKIINDGH